MTSLGNQGVQTTRKDNKIISNYTGSSIMIANFVPIHQKTWPPQAIIFSDWPIFKNHLL
jgi:hypothetical protein